MCSTLWYIFGQPSVCLVGSDCIWLKLFWRHRRKEIRHSAEVKKNLQAGFAPRLRENERALAACATNVAQRRGDKKQFSQLCPLIHACTVVRPRSSLLITRTHQLINYEFTHTHICIELVNVIIFPSLAGQFAEVRDLYNSINGQKWKSFSSMHTFFFSSKGHEKSFFFNGKTQGSSAAVANVAE